MAARLALDAAEEKLLAGAALESRRSPSLGCPFYLLTSRRMLLKSNFFFLLAAAAATGFLLVAVERAGIADVCASRLLLLEFLDELSGRALQQISLELSELAKAGTYRKWVSYRKEGARWLVVSLRLTGKGAYPMTRTTNAPAAWPNEKGEVFWGFTRGFWHFLLADR